MFDVGSLCSASPPRSADRMAVQAKNLVKVTGRAPAVGKCCEPGGTLLWPECVSMLVQWKLLQREERQADLNLPGSTELTPESATLCNFQDGKDSLSTAVLIYPSKASAQNKFEKITPRLK